MLQSALPGLSEAGAKNVIVWCETLGLCDRQGSLTALGEIVADTDEAPVPEQGVYDLWLAQHPVLGRRVLAAKRLASTRDGRFESIEPLAVEPDRGRVFRSVLGEKERFMVRDLPARRSGLVLETHAQCRLHWMLDFDHGRNRWRLEGTIEAPQGNDKHTMHNIQHTPESEDLDLWKLVAIWGTGPLSTYGRWQEEERRLAVACDGLTQTEIDTFRKHFTLARAEVPGKGTYKNVPLHDVPIAPSSAQHAQRWAMARFHHHLSTKPGYRSRSELRQLFATLVDDTPLESFATELPSHDELLSQTAGDAERFWFLVAPVDLSPFPVAADELAPFRIGASAPTATTEPIATVHAVKIPYRCDWSMQQLVDRLRCGFVPQRVLL